MYHVSAQGIDERMINVHYYYTISLCLFFNFTVSLPCLWRKHCVFHRISKKKLCNSFHFCVPPVSYFPFKPVYYAGENMMIT